MDAYVTWREACVRVSDAYDLWASGPARGEESAFEGYMAALEQEERAAEVYAGLARSAGQTVSRGDCALKQLDGAA